MPSRCIRLSRIHAIQWFGYCDSFDIHGNLLIAGRTGAGKSVLMDLIQLVLIGDQRSRYNAASDGRGHTSGRDKKSYCLCDTQEDVEGIPQFARDGGVTVIALEFTWPDGSKVETWGMRIEYANSGTQTPEEEFFRIPASLERRDFISSEGYVLDLNSFRSLVRRNEGETFRNVTEYRRQLAERLNFHRETIDFLMPSAMSFAFLPRFDEFCRRYILQSEDIKIEPVQQSYRSYLRIREELEKLQDKSHRLEETVAARSEWTRVKKDSDACRLLEAGFARDAARELVGGLAARLAELQEQQSRLQKKFEEVAVEWAAKRQELETLKNLLRDTGGAVVLQLREQIAEKEEKIARLQQIGRTVEEEKLRRITETRAVVEKAAAFLSERGAGNSMAEVGYALRQLEDARPNQLRDALRSLGGAVRSLIARARASVAQESEQLQKVRGEWEALQAQLKNLEFNRVLPSSPLLDELNRRLPRRGKHNPARQLRELCEVVDEAWRPALETVFTRKFAVLVDEEDFPEALSIYRELKNVSPMESLVNPKRSLSARHAVPAGSLAEKITSTHPVVNAVLREIFGSLVCVDSADQLQSHDNAILADGFSLRGSFAERPQAYDQRPCIGSKGIERLRAHLVAIAEKCTATIRSLEPLIARADELQRSVASQGLDSEDIAADIEKASQLGELVAERDRLKGIHDANATPEMEERIANIESLEKAISTLDAERLDLNARLQSGEHHGVLQRLDEARRRLERCESTYDETVSDLGAILDVSRCDELREEFSAKYPTHELRAQHAGQHHKELTSRLPDIEARLLLLRQNLVDHHPDLRAEPDFDPATDWNPSYAKLLERIRVEDMPLRQEQARAEEQRWQDLFRTTVAARLNQALGRVRDTIRDINYQLKKPIGDSQYHIRVDENPSREFLEYRRVLEACAITQDGDSIFASLATEAREGVEKVFKALVEEPDGKLAREFLDYRSYYRYDMEVSDPKRPELPAKSLNRHAEKFSGGEKQTPFYISILACYLRAYKRHLPLRYTEPSLGLVPIDEAFSKMSGERITDAIRSLRDVDLQGILSMSSGNWPYAIGECDQILAVHQRDGFVDGRKTIRNIGALLTRQEALERSEDWA